MRLLLVYVAPPFSPGQQNPAASPSTNNPVKRVTAEAFGSKRQPDGIYNDTNGNNRY